jgi:hypothetical protein
VCPAQRLLVPTTRGLTQCVLLPPLCGVLLVARLLLVSHLFHQRAAAVFLLRMLLLRTALVQLVLVSFQQLHVRPLLRR